MNDWAIEQQDYRTERLTHHGHTFVPCLRRSGFAQAGETGCGGQAREAI